MGHFPLAEIFQKARPCRRTRLWTDEVSQGSLNFDKCSVYCAQGKGWFETLIFVEPMRCMEISSFFVDMEDRTHENKIRSHLSLFPKNHQCNFIFRKRRIEPTRTMLRCLSLFLSHRFRSPQKFCGAHAIYGTSFVFAKTKDVTHVVKMMLNWVS